MVGGIGDPADITPGRLGVPGGIEVSGPVHPQVAVARAHKGRLAFGGLAVLNDLFGASSVAAGAAAAGVPNGGDAG